MSVYIDDVIVFSATLDDHLQHLELVICRLVEAGLKLKPEKCHFARQEIEYLGHLVTPMGLKPATHHVQAVVGFTVPTNLKEVRQFLGLAFVKGFAGIAGPLHQLTRKDTPFV